MRSLRHQVEWYRRAQWFLGTGAGLAAIIFYFAGYRPAAHRLESMRIQTELRQRELDHSRVKASNIDILARELQKLQAQARAYDRQCPQRAEFGQFIKDIGQISQQLALQEWKYEQALPKRSDGYFEQPVILHFAGEFPRVASFLRRIEDMPRLTRVKRIEMKNRDTRSGVVQVEMAMSIYYSEG